MLIFSDRLWAKDYFLCEEFKLFLLSSFYIEIEGSWSLWLSRISCIVLSSVIRVKSLSWLLMTLLILICEIDKTDANSLFSCETFLIWDCSWSIEDLLSSIRLSHSSFSSFSWLFSDYKRVLASLRLSLFSLKLSFIFFRLASYSFIIEASDFKELFSALMLWISSFDSSYFFYMLWSSLLL